MNRKQLSKQTEDCLNQQLCSLACVIHWQLSSPWWTQSSLRKQKTDLPLSIWTTSWSMQQPWNYWKSNKTDFTETMRPQLISESKEMQIWENQTGIFVTHCGRRKTVNRSSKSQRFCWLAYTQVSKRSMVFPGLWEFLQEVYCKILYLGSTPQ